MKRARTRFLLLAISALAAGLFLSGCASRKADQSNLALPDHAWLLEMIAQRMEVEAGIARARIAASLPPVEAEEREASLAALVEQSARAGLPPMPVRQFFEAQLEASAEYERILRGPKGEGGLPDSQSPPVPVSAVLDAIDGQILATLGRIGNIPSDRGLYRACIRKLRDRGIPPRPARIAAAPLLRLPAAQLGTP